MADTKVFSFPENGNNANNIPFSIPIGGNGFGFGNGMNGIVDLFGLAIIASIFGWNNGGFGGWGGNAGGAGFLSNQLNNDSGLRMSVMCIGDATSLEQWWDTLDHEIDHLQYVIMEYYDVSPGTEEAAWLQGYIMRLIVKALRQDGIMFL